jgi:hypothetical protein
VIADGLRIEDLVKIIGIPLNSVPERGNWKSRVRHRGARAENAVQVGSWKHE